MTTSSITCGNSGSHSPVQPENNRPAQMSCGDIGRIAIVALIVLIPLGLIIAGITMITLGAASVNPILLQLGISALGCGVVAAITLIAKCISG